MKIYFYPFLLIFLFVGCTSNNSQKGKESRDNSSIMEQNGHAYVDLGLPSGLLWATMNVGSESPWDCGAYFAWGETNSKSRYSWELYKWGNGQIFTKYNADVDDAFGKVDNKQILEKEDDAAAVNWGGNWRMPTRAEQNELLTQCKWTWTST